MAASPSEAQRLLDERRVEVGGVPTPKAATLVGRDTPIELAPDDPGYVGRGAFKLEGALADFGIEVEGRRALDAGASTGGFTDVLLRHGATQVVALDVGYGQLDQRLRQDRRVVVMERTNLRHIDPHDTGGPFSLIVADLSFISLCTVAEALARLAEPGADLILLIKPQFEAPKREVGAGGIVRDESVRRRAVDRAVRCLAEHGLGPQRLSPAAIDGTGGNREVFVCCSAGAEPVTDLEVPA